MASTKSKKHKPLRGEALKAEMDKRVNVMVKTRKSLIIKIYYLLLHEVLALGFGPPIERDEEEIEGRHLKAAKVLKVDPYAYGTDKVRTGFRLYDKVPNVRTTNLLDHLAAAGLHFTGGHYYMIKGDKDEYPVLVLSFSAEGEQEELPVDVLSWIMTYLWENVTVYCNLCPAPKKGARRGRTDSIDLFNGGMSEEPALELELWEGSYSIKEPQASPAAAGETA